MDTTAKANEILEKFTKQVRGAVKRVAIIGGGTIVDVRPHLALTAPAHGMVVNDLRQIINDPTMESTSRDKSSFVRKSDPPASTDLYSSMAIF